MRPLGAAAALGLSLACAGAPPAAPDGPRLPTPLLPDATAPTRPGYEPLRQEEVPEDGLLGEEEEPWGRFVLKGGPYAADGLEVDDGWGVSVGYLAVGERNSLGIELAYFEREGPGRGEESWILPFLVNWQVVLVRVERVELFTGLGIGLGFHYESGGVHGTLPVEEEMGWPLGAGFLGVRVPFDGFALGVEGRYQATREIEAVGDTPFDGVSVLLTVGLDV